MAHLKCSVCAAVFAIFWQATPAFAADERPVIELLDGLFVSQGPHEQMSASNQGSIGNSGFIIGQKAVAVIDPGGSVASGERLKRAIRKVTDLPIEFLILTHFHPDHVAGGAAFAETPHIIAHENYARAMTQRAQFYVDRFPDFLVGTVQELFRIPTQSVTIGQQVELDLGNRTLVVEAYPLAHTDNDVTVVDQNTNTIWASDLVFAQRTPSLDGSLIGWLEVLTELEARNYDLTIPGHGVPGKWEEITASQKYYLAELRDTVREMLADGITLSAVLTAHDQQDFENTPWILYAAQHGSNLAKAYTELEWE